MCNKKTVKFTHNHCLSSGYILKIQTKKVLKQIMQKKVYIFFQLSVKFQIKNKYKENVKIKKPSLKTKHWKNLQNDEYLFHFF